MSSLPLLPDSGPRLVGIARLAAVRESVRSVWLKGGNHSVKDAFSKAFIKRGVSLEPSEEQGASKRVDQQLWIRRGLQFAGRNSVFDDSALDLTPVHDISLQERPPESLILVDTSKDASHDRTLF
jgi:hypothetical protein